MARRKSKANANADAAEAAPALEPVAAAAGEAAGGTPPDLAGAAPRASASYAADPQPTISVSLSDYRGGPSAHLLRSHKFNQMQIRFNGQQPDEQFLAMLKENGWRDRTESEGIWTKQIDRDARWQSVQKMEQEFKAVANAIRDAKGLAPALEALSPA